MATGFGEMFKCGAEHFLQSPGGMVDFYEVHPIIVSRQMKVFRGKVVIMAVAYEEHDDDARRAARPFLFLAFGHFQ